MRFGAPPLVRSPELSGGPSSPPRVDQDSVDAVLRRIGLLGNGVALGDRRPITVARYYGWYDRTLGDRRHTGEAEPDVSLDAGSFVVSLRSPSNDLVS